MSRARFDDYGWVAGRLVDGREVAKLLVKAVFFQTSIRDCRRSTPACQRHDAMTSDAAVARNVIARSPEVRANASPTEPMKAHPMKSGTRSSGKDKISGEIRKKNTQIEVVTTGTRLRFAGIFCCICAALRKNERAEKQFVTAIWIVAQR